MESSKEDLNIITMFTKDGKFDIGSAFRYVENVNKHQEERILALEEAMMFFSKWYNETQRANIILPDNLNENGSTKLIL